jgi:hypothetical protein
MKKMIHWTIWHLTRELLRMSGLKKEAVGADGK